jgi:ABC-type sugar transport system ATPase subunit
LDEPLSQLDPHTRLALRHEIVRLQKEVKVPMIYVTHDQPEAMAIGNRIAILRHGSLQQIGSAQELRQQPANQFVASFLNAA